MQHEAHKDKGNSRRAAQYVRMSTDYQKYSPENQAAAIAAYAAQRNLEIVRTYNDYGRSGLRLEGREALQELMRDVKSGNADFKIMLVYDVSRWGRFQDADESAYYEFMCKEAGRARAIWAGGCKLRGWGNAVGHQPRPFARRIISAG
jgi:DNA invertase Pin-like site-specific DNA recombinase